MTDFVQVAAIDLGATSGRVVKGTLADGRVSLEVVSRFPNEPVWGRDGLRWNLSGLYQQSLAGLAKLVQQSPQLLSVGIDSWAVDYGLLSGSVLTAEPFHYRDERNNSAVEAVHDLISPAELYGRNGLQFLPFNTLYQLTSDRLETGFDPRATLLLIPDLLNFWLSGKRCSEMTNASTTGFLNVATSAWDERLMTRLQIPTSVLPPLIAPGTTIGPTTKATNATLGLGSSIDVVAVGSHDTASAVLGTPMDPANCAYISCGTWGLVGLELDKAVVTDEARLAGFTNEGGVDGTVRFLHNVMGLWLLSETIREWEKLDGTVIDIDQLLREASEVKTAVGIFDVDNERFLAAGPMQSRILGQCADQGLAVPRSRAETVRSIIESLAHAFAQTVHAASLLTGVDVEQVHLVGGGAMNALLCQSTATRLGLPLVAGPVEATAFGNVLVQLRATGACSGELADLRAVVKRSSTTTTYVPKHY